MTHIHMTRFSGGDLQESYDKLSELASVMSGVSGVESCRVFLGEGEQILMTEFTEFATFDRLRDDASVKLARQAQALAGLRYSTEWLSGSDPSYIYK